MYAYVPISLLTGAPTEELRTLEWDRVDLDGDPPTLDLWRSVRTGGDIKTRKSRRTLELPTRCVDVLRAHRLAQLRTRVAAGPAWQDTGLVFTTGVGTQLDAANVRRAYRRVIASAGLDPADWTTPTNSGTRSCRCCPPAVSISKPSRISLDTPTLG
jgi:integrase